MTSLEPVRRWIERCTRRRVVVMRRLPGATSSVVHRASLEDGPPVVVRRYLPFFLEAEPDAPAREVDALQLVSRSGLIAPEPVAADLHGDAVGDGAARLLMTALPGRPVPTPDAASLASVAASIHAVDASGFGHEYFPWYGGQATVPALASDPALWREAIALWLAGPPPYDPVLVHRDFHPGNLLWRRRRLSGIVDWANACLGPWGCDLAHCRSNLVDLGRPDLADDLVVHYERATGRSYDPYWDLASILEHGPSWWAPPVLARHEPRLARALAALR